MKNKKTNYNKSVDGLRKVEAPDIWSSIQSELDGQKEENRENLLNAIESLPVHEAPDIWLPITSQISIKKSPIWKNLSIAAAVSILLVSFGYLVWVNDSAPKEKLTYSTEEVEFFEASIDPDFSELDADNMVLTYIKENCTRLAATCQDPEFKELLEAYIELNETKEKLNADLGGVQKHPQMMKYLIKVEKDQAEIGRNMLKKLKSI